MPRFFLTDPVVRAGTLLLTGDAAAHGRVLRLRPGEAVTVCDGRGTDYRCSVAAADGQQLKLTVLETVPAAGEPRVRVTVMVAFPKADKFEHVLQKATELGAAEIAAFPSARCISRLDERAAARKLERWQKIAASAAEQSGRGQIPAVRVFGSYAEALRTAAQQEFAALLYEDEHRLSFRRAVGNGRFATAALLTGPEGGFTLEEADAAAAAGIRLCTLGPRILRCETAPLCALSALMFACGELDGPDRYGEGVENYGYEEAGSPAEEADR